MTTWSTRSNAKMNTSAPPPSRGVRRRAAAAAAAIVGLAVCWAWLHGALTAAAPKPSLAPAWEPPREAALQRLASATAVDGPATPRPIPVIDGIDVEKPSVCAGEENLVRVRAHGADGDGPYLRYAIGAHNGDAVPLRVWDDGVANHDWPKVYVYGRDGAVTMADVPRFKVRACTEHARVAIEQHAVANAWGEYRFVAKLPLVAHDGAHPIREFVWELGDGTRQTTRGPSVSHSYARRKQETLVSSFVVSVRVLREGADALAGRTALELHNEAFRALHVEGVAMIMPSFTPRIPTPDGAGVVRQTVQLTVAGETPVAVRRVTISELSDDGTLGEPVDVDPVTAFGARMIEPGPGLSFLVSFDPHAHRDALALHYTVQGVTSEGVPAYGSFSVMRPTPRLAPDRGEAIVDPALAQKIQRAQEVLGKSEITESELARLDEDGSLGDGR